MKLFILSQLIFTNIILSQPIDTLKTKKFQKFNILKNLSDSTKKHNHFELSFGQNLLFISTQKQNQFHSTESIVLPTSSVLFFIEFRPQKTLRIPVFLNIATESKQFLVNGQLIYEKASPTVGTGAVFNIIQYHIDSKSKIELEIGPLMSFIIDKKNEIRFAPIIASRIKICRGENFVMYLGANYSLGVDAFGLMYGTGTVF
jgi:hypothetical protein